MKHIRRKITVSVLGTMLFVFAVLLATVNIFIPEYLTSEAQKAILLEDERKDPIPLAEATDDREEHFLTSSVRYLEVEEGLTESEHLSKAEYQLRKYCREEKPAAGEFHTLKTGGSRFVFRISQVEAGEYEDAYRTGSLVWDKATSVRPDGSAELSFFETLYQNVNAGNAEKVLAPGTEKDSVVRLKNDTNKEITYTAVLYSLSTSPDLDIGATLSGDGFSDTSLYTLPKSIEEEAVIRVVGGRLDAKKLQDFNINWFWNFEDGANTDKRDGIDTYLGNKAANGKADEATLGFYLVVYDDSEVLPLPGTGDDTMIGGYVVLMLISGGMCLFLTITRKRRERVED